MHIQCTNVSLNTLRTKVTLQPQTNLTPPAVQVVYDTGKGPETTESLVKTAEINGLPPDYHHQLPPTPHTRVNPNEPGGFPPVAIDVKVPVN